MKKIWGQSEWKYEVCIVEEDDDDEIMIGMIADQRNLTVVSYP